MRSFVWLSLFALLASNASAQRRGSGHGGFGRGGFGSGLGRSTFVNRGFGFNRGFNGFPYGLGWSGYFGDFLPYDVGAEYGYQEQPNVVVVQQPPAPQVSTQQPPCEAQPIIQTITVAPSPSTTRPPTQGESPTFGIVLKNGTVLSATAVVVEDNVLKYVDPDQRNREIPLAQVDRDATRRLNRERNLNFWLPG